MDLNDVDFEEPFEESGSQETLEQTVEELQLPEGVTPVSSLYQGPTGVSPEEGGNQPTDDLVTEYLKMQGIADPSKIKFTDETGLIQEKDWNQLSREEQLNIMTTSQAQPERDLSGEEIKLINELRRYNLTPDQYINNIRQQATRDYADSINANPQYNVDNLTDDEIYLLDLQDKVEDITEDELVAALEAAKQNPDLYAKQVQGIRSTLKDQENAYNQQLQAQQQAAAEEQFQYFQNQIVDSIQNFNRVGDLNVSLDEDDMENIAAFILDKDDTGMSYMGKALNNPQTIVEMAWWALKGREVLNGIQDYFANEIKNARQQSYQKGLEEGRKNGGRVVYKPQATTPGGGRVATIDDIWG